MPITLVTGLPGHGKTLYTLARFKPEAEKAGRPVFHNAIPGLAIPGWQSWDVDKWQDLPAGSLFVIDEAQFAFPVTGRGQTPDWVQKLATHRHLGIDLVVITQDPMLLDNFVRRLVDRHFHVVRKFGTRFATIYEYVNGAKQDVSKSRGTDGIRHEWRYPSDVFAWYKSAEVHTVKARIPARVWILAVMPFIFGGLVYMAYQSLRPSKVVEKTQGAVAAPGAGASSPLASASSLPPGGIPPGGRAGAGSAGMSPGEYVNAYTPRIAGLAHTAPIYDGVTAPREAPYPAACIASAKRCQCYSQQSTRLDMSEQLCRQLSDGGMFVAWSPNGDRVARVQEAPKADARSPGQAPSPSEAVSLLPSYQAPVLASAGSRAEPGPPGAPGLVRRVNRAVQ